MEKILVINGPNLNLLGHREPVLYGNTSFEQYLGLLRETFKEVSIEYQQHNVEGDLVKGLHLPMDGSYQGVVINAAAYSHTSIAVADAVSALRGAGVSVVEVHISNIFAREAYRHQSYVSKVASGVISGLGLEGYKLAISYLLKQA